MCCLRAVALLDVPAAVRAISRYGESRFGSFGTGNNISSIYSAGAVNVCVSAV